MRLSDTAYAGPNLAKYAIYREEYGTFQLPKFWLPMTAGGRRRFGLLRNIGEDVLAVDSHTLDASGRAEPDFDSGGSSESRDTM